jgi:hypothetical protein
MSELRWIGRVNRTKWMIHVRISVGWVGVNWMKAVGLGVFEVLLGVGRLVPIMEGCHLDGVG